ncbi:hypothetical protein TESS_TESS_00019 [Tessaracoccus sp. O5.2]|uniref:M23 family metallopeptidase n=1 Tax=Tessaracoccus sp. O5.2 TaxID=3157622 RepID=UPI0035F0CDAF
MNRDLPPRPVTSRPLTGRFARGIAATVAALSMITAFGVPAEADELDDRKSQLQQEMAAQSDAVEDANADLSAAVGRHNEAKANLAAAEAKLAKAEAAERDAQALDELRAAELEAAEIALGKAEADVAAALAALESVNRRINEEVLVTTQQSDGLLNLALLFTDVTTSNLNQRAQLAQTLFDSSAKQLDELEMRRLALEDAQAAADAARDTADAARQAAAEQLRARQAAVDEAAALRTEVALLVEEAAAAQQAAQGQLAAEEARQAALQQEAASVEARIQARIAAAKKAAAEKAAREKAAREKAARDAAAKAPADKAAAAKAAASTSRSTSTVSRPAVAAPTSRFLMPVGARITSRYGMRLHPVLGYWKLHDGTDFGASCGTPIRAAEDGVVSERYYNSGYGNRLMIDHGLLDGDYVTTGYNHASRYTVRVGQRVSRGQVIGYVGNTGYSTGCHLHLMVWEDGSVVNPLAKWFG